MKKVSEEDMGVPIYIKDQEHSAWPTDQCFYVLTGSGLHLCRNHQFFQSCVRAPQAPRGLPPQHSFLKLRYPKVPRRYMELFVGFFDEIGKRHGSEAAVLLVWNEARQRMQFVVPDQIATVSRSWWGDAYPIGVEYQTPANLKRELMIIGDIHSHVDLAAYSSYTDKQDETYRPGLHIVVGHIDQEPPQFHAEVVVDGTRFKVEPGMVIEGYHRRRPTVPEEWIEKVQIESRSVGYQTSSYGTGQDQNVQQWGQSQQ